MNERKKRNLKRLLIVAATIGSLLLGSRNPEITKTIINTLTNEL